jgi:hypothetical protein
MFLLHLLEPDIFLVIAVPCLGFAFWTKWNVEKQQFERRNAFGLTEFDSFTQAKLQRYKWGAFSGGAAILNWIGGIALFCHVFMAAFAH